MSTASGALQQLHQSSTPTDAMIGSFMNLSRRSTSEKQPGHTAPADIPAAREKQGAMKA
jgi:hypothetical protein